jgi:hypothetical protein
MYDHIRDTYVLAVSESWLRKATKNPDISIPKYNMSDKIEQPKGAELQSTAEIVRRVLSYCPGLCPNSLSFYI